MSILDDIFENLFTSGYKAYNKAADSVLEDAEKKIQKTRVKVQKTIIDLDDNGEPIEIVEGEFIETEKGKV